MFLRKSRVLLLFLPLILIIHMPTLSHADSEIPFGIDIPFPFPYPSDGDAMANEADLVRETGLISDTVFRKAIESEEEGETVFTWRSVNNMLRFCIDDLNATVWFCINPTTDVYSAGSVEVSPGEYLPHTGESLVRYRIFLRNLIRHCRFKNWEVAYWGVHNEPHHDYLAAFPDDLPAAAKAYSKLVKITYTIIKVITPEASVVLGGFGSNTSPEGRQFYRSVVNHLNLKDPDRINNGYFDYADFHNYNYHTGYKTNRKGLGVSWFREEILAPFQFEHKEIFMKEGATHTGKDVDAGPAASTYQSESEQAGYMVKRFIYNYAHGASKIQWTIQHERDTFKQDPHSFFVYVGLTYNGLPTGDEDWFDVAKHVADPQIHVYVDNYNPLLYHFVTWLFEENIGWKTAGVRDAWLEELSLFLSAGQLQELQELGEIWISQGVEKLSFYAYKLLVDKLRECDWSSMEIFQEDVDGVYLYRFLKQGQPVYIAWWDWFEDPGLTEKVVSLTLPQITTDSVLVTEAIPRAESGAEAEVFLEHYPDQFATAAVSVSNDTVTFTIGQSPVFIEEATP